MLKFWNDKAIVYKVLETSSCIIIEITILIEASANHRRFSISITRTGLQTKSSSDNLQNF